MEDDALRPVISIVAQSVSIEPILPPEMRHSRPALFKQAKKALGIQSRRDGFGRDGCGPGRCRPSPPTEYAKHGSIPWLRCRRGGRHGRLWRGSFPTSPAAFQTQYRGWRERAHPLDHLNGAGLLWCISGGKISSMETDRDQRDAAHHP